MKKFSFDPKSTFFLKNFVPEFADISPFENKLKKSQKKFKKRLTNQKIRDIIYKSSGKSDKQNEENVGV